MSILTLMRHGQAAFGAARYDALSPLGQSQARATGEWMLHRVEPPTRFLHGPRHRQSETARCLAAAHAAHPEPDCEPLLDEFAEGEEVLAAAEAWFKRPMQGPDAPPRQEQLRCHSEAVDAWTQNRLQIPGRANLDEFSATVRQWWHLTKDAPNAPRGQRILAVTSAGVIAVVVCDVLGLNQARWRELIQVIDNASLTEIEYSTGRASLRSFNSTAHLQPSLISRF